MTDSYFAVVLPIRTSVLFELSFSLFDDIHFGTVAKKDRRLERASTELWDENDNVPSSNRSTKRLTVFSSEV